MSDFDDILLDEPSTPPAQATPPVVADSAGRDWQAQSTQKQAEQKRVRSGVHPIWAGLLAFMAAVFFTLWLSFILSPAPAPNPNVDPVDGVYVAIFYQDSEKTSYTDDQRSAMDSASMAQFLDETVTGWKKIDVDQIGELKNLNPIYAEMADQHRTKLPWAVVRSGKRLGSEEIVNGDALIELVNRTVK